jgi:hypothetical protein
MAKTKDWPRVRKGLNGAGLTSWIVDLRPYGKRKYFSSKDAALGEAQIQRSRLRKEGLEGFEFTGNSRIFRLMRFRVGPPNSAIVTAGTCSENTST